MSAMGNALPRYSPAFPPQILDSWLIIATSVRPRISTGFRASFTEELKIRITAQAALTI